MDRLSQIQNIHIEEVFKKGVRPSSKKDDQVKQASFGDVLADKIAASDVKFSKHAMARISSRNIRLSQEQIQDLSQAVNKAQEKGSRESLIMMNDIALVVSVRNKTVITAMNSQNLKENVVTNIDSAIII